MFAELKPIEGLSVRTQFSARLGGRWSMTFSPRTIATNKEGSATNSLTENANWGLDWQWTNTATYTTTFNEDHNLTVLLGSEAMKEDFGRTMEASRIDYLFEDEPNTWILDNGSSSNLSNSGYMADLTTMFGVFGRVDYSYQGKYLATLQPGVMPLPSSVKPTDGQHSRHSLWDGVFRKNLSSLSHDQHGWTT